jgi:hypothetical protein
MRVVKILESFGKIRAYYWSCAGLWFSTTQVSARLDNYCCRVGFCFRVSRLPPNCGASFSCFGACKSCELFPASSMAINTSFASLQHRDSLATCTAVCAAWRYTHAAKMFGMANQSPLALACRMTPLLCSVRSSVRDQGCSRSEWHGSARSHLTSMGHAFFKFERLPHPIATRSSGHSLRVRGDTQSLYRSSKRTMVTPTGAGTPYTVRWPSLETTQV